MKLRSESYGSMADNTEITRFILENGSGVRVGIINYGAIVESIVVPDRNGEFADIALGFDNLKGWTERNAPYFGAVIGRCANRIGAGRFSIDGVEYQLAVNNGPNCLHGGLIGFDKKVWAAEDVSSGRGPAVRLTLTSPDGDENFPGELSCSVTYTLRADNGLVMEYAATTDKPTIVNLTNHTYFNLGGHDGGHIDEHIIRIDADAYTPNDENNLPLGTVESLDGKPFDLRKATQIGRCLEQIDGFDHNYVLRSGNGLDRPVANVRHPPSGRSLTVYTTEPGMQLYSADYLDGIEGKDGTVYENQTAFCLEAQRFPDSVNHANFPDVVLRPGARYGQTTIYRFDSISPAGGGNACSSAPMRALSSLCARTLHPVSSGRCPQPRPSRTPSLPDFPGT